MLFIRGAEILVVFIYGSLASIQNCISYMVFLQKFEVEKRCVFNRTKFEQACLRWRMDIINVPM